MLGLGSLGIRCSSNRTGKATRLQDYLLELEKSYIFDIKFGQATYTLDVEGDVYEELPYDHITEEQLTELAKSLEGVFEQVPPIFQLLNTRENLFMSTLDR